MPAAGIHTEDKSLHEALVNLRPGGLGPEGVADMVCDAIAANQLYCLTTDAFDSAIRDRSDCVLARRNPQFSDLLTLSQNESAARLKG